MGNRAAELRAEIQRRGDARRAALETAATELEAITKLAPAAIKAGLTKVEISELGAVGRPTLDAKLASRRASR